MNVEPYGHYGRPVLAFASEGGHAKQWEDMGMVGAIGDLLEAGRVKLYCVDSHDMASWSNRDIPTEQRAHEHNRFEAWLLEEIVPRIQEDSSTHEILVTGASMGAFHAANIALKRADLFPVALCMSGNYDPTHWHSWGERGDATYFNNPMDYVGHLHGDHLDWLRSRLTVQLVVGQGQWEDTTGALESTRAFGSLLDSKELRCEVDIWGYDVPHDWHSWRAQLAHHLPRFC